MTARALGPAILVDGESLATLRWCAAVAVREKRRNGTRPGPLLDQLDQAAAQALAAAQRHDDTPTLDDQQPCDQWVSTRTVAEQLRCSPRTAQRLAARLDGRKVGGVWLIDPQAVNEHQAQQKGTHP